MSSNPPEPEHTPEHPSESTSVPASVSEPERKNLLWFRGDIWSGVLIFLVAAGFWAYLLFNPENPYYSDSDSFYHVKMAEMLQTFGILHKFPWLQFTTLNEHFVDQHFLYHVLLIPFIKFFGIAAGPKLCHILILASVFLWFHLILKNCSVPGAWVFTLAGLFGLPYHTYARLCFIRAVPLSLLIVLMAIYGTFKGNKILLAVVSFVYVWAYGTFTFIPIFIVIYLATQFLREEKINGEVPLAVGVSLILGLLLNPYFPDLLGYLYTQVFQTGLGAKPYTGLEWKSEDTFTWLMSNYIALAFPLVGITLSLLHGLRHSTKTISVFLYSVFFILLHFKSYRFIEYSPIFLILSGVLLLKPFLDQKLIEYWEAAAWRKPQNRAYALAFVLATIIFIDHAFFNRFSGMYRDYGGQISQARFFIKTPFSMSALYQLHQFLAQNSADKDIIFTDSWHISVVHLFFSTKNYYLVGLDPEFMYQYQGTPYPGQKGVLFEEYTDISRNLVSEKFSLIKTHFNAKWVVLSLSNQKFYQALKNQPHLFQEVFVARNNPAIDTHSSAANDGYYVFKVL